MSFARLALRNLGRNRRRTALSLAMVAAGTAVLLLTAGFIAHSFTGLAEAMIHGGLGHLEIVQREAAEGRTATLERPLALGLIDWRELQAEAERLPRVQAATANLHLLGMATGPRGASASFAGLGVEPERERRMGFRTRLRRGEGLAPAASAQGEETVVLAQGLAESLDAEPGEIVTLLALTEDGTLNALDVRVAGVFTSGVQELDTRLLKLHLASAQRLLATARVSNLIVGLAETERTAEAAAALGKRLRDHRPPLAILTWEERAPFYRQVRNLYLGIFWFLGTVIFVLVILAASNTLAMTVLERVREIGALRAVGTSRSQVAALFLWEALWLGLFGALAGDGLGALLIALLNSLAIEMPPPPGAVDPIALELAFVPQALVGVVPLMLLVLAAAAILPSLRAARLSVVEALRHV